MAIGGSCGTRSWVFGVKDFAGVTHERLVPNGKVHLLEVNIHIVARGGGSVGRMRHKGDEIGYVLEERLTLSIDDTTYEIGPGDSFSFRRTPRTPTATAARTRRGSSGSLHRTF